MKPWNHCHHEAYETMKPLTPRNLWNHETIDTTKPMKPRNTRNFETIDTTKLMKPRNTWNYEAIDTTKPMKPWFHDTFIIWHRHWHILISINSCTVTPSCNPKLGSTATVVRKSVFFSISHITFRGFARTFFPTTFLEIAVFWCKNLRPRWFTASDNSAKPCIAVSIRSSCGMGALLKHMSHFEEYSNSALKHLRWYGWVHPTQVALPWFFLMVLLHLKHFKVAGPGFCNTSPQRSTKFIKSTSLARWSNWVLQQDELFVL